MTLGRSLFTQIVESHSSRFLRNLGYGHSIASQPLTLLNSLFCYTSGRWLWTEREQLESRSRRRPACRAVGANQCVSLEKIGEGNHNKAYRLLMEDGQRVIAKIPHPNAGPAVLTTASEVATMEFARTVLNLPVPKVLAWSSTDENPVEAEYIFMEEAKGSQLHEIWQDLPLQAKCDIVHKVVDIERKLLSISFNKLLSISFNKYARCSMLKSVANMTNAHQQSRIIVFQQQWYSRMRTCDCYNQYTRSQ